MFLQKQDLMNNPSHKNSMIDNICFPTWTLPLTWDQDDGKEKIMNW